jgi:hypothetical protein
MPRRGRTILLLAIGCLLIAGLLVAGPAHHGLHKTSDGVYCDGCAVTGTVPTPAPCLRGPMQVAHASSAERPLWVPSPTPLVTRSPRGPPTAA